MSYTLSPWLRNLNTDFTLGNCFLRSVKLTKNTDPDKYICTSYVTEFNSCAKFLFAGRNFGKKCNYF